MVDVECRVVGAEGIGADGGHMDIRLGLGDGENELGHA